MKHLVKYFIWVGIIIIAIIGDSAKFVAEMMERAFHLSVAKIREIEEQGGAHERRTLRPAEVEQV